MDAVLESPTTLPVETPEAAEARLRRDLAACYRLIARFGWDDLIFTHVSVRLPGPEHHFLINPYGMLFDEITASSLVKVDLDGRQVQDSPHPVNPAGFTIHSAIHRAREDAWCVLHVHSLNGIAVSTQDDRLGYRVREQLEDALGWDRGDDVPHNRLQERLRLGTRLEAQTQKLREYEEAYRMLENI